MTLGSGPGEWTAVSEEVPAGEGSRPGRCDSFPPAWPGTGLDLPWPSAPPRPLRPRDGSGGAAPRNRRHRSLPAGPRCEARSATALRRTLGDDLLPGARSDRPHLLEEPLGADAQ